jgi:hypothetical protein
MKGRHPRRVGSRLAEETEVQTKSTTGLGLSGRRAGPSLGPAAAFVPTRN